MKSKFLSDLFAVLGSKVGVIVFGLGSSVVTARYLGPEGNGTISAMMIFPNLFMTIGSLGIRQSTTYYTGQNKYSTESIYGAVISVFVFTSIVCTGGSFLLIKYLTKNDAPLHLNLLAISAVPFSLYITYSSGIFLGKQNIKEFNRINWIPAFLNFVFTFFLVAILHYGVVGSMVGTSLSVFFMALIVLVKMRGQISKIKLWNFEIIKGMLALGVVYALSLIITSLNYKVDVILLERLSNRTELGLYTKGVAIVEYLWQIPMLLSTLIFSRSAAAKDSFKFSQKACRLLRFAVIAIAIMSVGLYFCSGWIIKLLYGDEFEGSVSILKILIPGVLLMTIFKVLNMDTAGRGKPWLSITAMLPAVVINIILNYLWIPKYGADGSSMASTVSYSLAALTFLFIYSREVGIPVLDIIKFTKEDKEIFNSIVKSVKAKIFN